jgi:16S rRNA (cytidine1402-2'-O)-methyltransferase
LKTLKQIDEFIGGNRQSCIVRELTKVYETFHRGLITEQIIFFEKNPPKGEIVIVLEGFLI